MLLKDVPIETRRRLTRMSPTLVSSFPNTGKSFCVEQLSSEDKRRTIIVDLENKGLPNTFDDEYRTIVRIKPSGLIPKEKEHLYVNYDNVAFKTLAELMPALRKALANKDVDRLVVDSFSSLVEKLEVLYVTTSNGYTVWNAYNKELSEWFALLKEETRFNAKFVYILGHYRPSKAAKDLKTGKVVTDTEAEKYTLVKGNVHFRMVEANFNCVLTLEDHKLLADNDNAYDSTRIHMNLSPFETEMNSFKELEEKFAAEFNPEKTAE